MLVCSVDIPGGGEIELCRGAASREGEIAAIDCVAQHTETLVLTLDLAPVGVGRLEDIAQRALGVVDLGLQVVALADHRSIQLDAGTNGKTKFVVGVTLGTASQRV